MYLTRGSRNVQHAGTPEHKTTPPQLAVFARKNTVTKYTEVLTPAERAEGQAIAAEILQTRGYQLARKWIAAAGLVPRQRWKTCSVERVRHALQASTGVLVSIEELLLALADAGFVAREIDGEASTNVMLSTLPKRGARVLLSAMH